MRERAFAVLGNRVSGASFLDLYAGTGAVGLEALSRGADRVVFVESHRRAAALVRSNCLAFELEQDRAKLMVRKVGAAIEELARSGEVFEVAWADPPFERWDRGLKHLGTAFANEVLSAEAIACLECPERADVVAALPEGLKVARELAGGASRVVMLELASRGDG
jgi:16S rRNA (guanine(966)-N(2))-methyltransferase RsmD